MKIAGSVRNRGRFDAEIVRATFSWLATASQGSLAQAPRLSSDLLDGHVRGMTLPTPLAAETGKEFTVVDLRGVDLGLAVALHDRRPASLIFHTAAGRTAKAAIKYAKS